MTITLRNLAFAYGPLPVFEGVTAEARPGRVTAVLGPNAAGKSTLLRCAAGALRPSAGEALVDGRSAARLRGRELARRVAYVAQRSTVAAAFTVREVVELGRYALEPDPGRVAAALRRLALDDVADRPYLALSVGQQQRVALARAVAQASPDGSLILDEPTAAMDLRHARDALGLLRELAAGGGTVLIAIHELRAAAAVADDVWLVAPSPSLPAGGPSRLEAVGSVDEVLQPARLRGVFGVGFEWVERGGGRRELLADVGGGDPGLPPAGPSSR